jgi:glucose/arabinose dehydrogenase
MMFPQWEGKVTRRRAPRADARPARGERRQKVVAEEPLLVDQHSRIRGVRIGPEGAVDVITDGRQADEDHAENSFPGP